MKSIHKYNYPLGTGFLKISTIEDLDQSTKLDIGFLIRIIESQLNAKIIDSSAYKIKNSQKGFEINVEDEMILYLKFCIDLELQHGIVSLIRDSQEIPVFINEENFSVTKLDEFTFSNDEIKKYFLIKLIKDLLTERKISDYLIESSVIKYSTRSKFLNTSFDLDGISKPITFPVNGWSYIYKVVNQNRNVKIKFAYNPIEVFMKEIIYIGSDFIQIYKEKDEIAQYNTLDEIEAYRKTRNYAFIINTVQDEIHYF